MRQRSALAADLTRDSGRQFFPDFNAAGLERHHLRREVQNSCSRLFTLNPARVDVGDQITFAVGLSRTRTKRHVCGKTFGSGKSRTLPDQQHGYARLEEIADVIEDANPAEANGKWFAHTPLARDRSIHQERQQSRNLNGDRRGRKTITDDDLEISSSWTQGCDLVLGRGG